MEYAYIRVSSRDQNIDRQVEAMRAVSIKDENMFIDRQSGKDFNRKNYKRLVRQMKKGDVLYVKSIDRLGRNYDEILKQWHYLTSEKSVEIVVLDFPLLNTKEQVTGVTGQFVADLVLEILSYVAQIERENIKQRQQEGIIIAQKNGVKFGRPKTEYTSRNRKLFDACIDKTISIREAARTMHVSNHTLKRMLEEYIADQK